MATSRDWAGDSAVSNCVRRQWADHRQHTMRLRDEGNERRRDLFKSEQRTPIAQSNAFGAAHWNAP
jgi:hypothetical protein